MRTRDELKLNNLTAREGATDMNLRALTSGRRRDHHPRDLDQEPGFMQKLSEDLMRAGPPLESAELPVNHFAPKQMRIEEAIMEGNDELKSKISSTLNDVRQVVKSEITRMRDELDNLERAVDESCDVARHAMENALNIAAHSLAATNDIRNKIAQFKLIVQNTIPEEDKQLARSLRQDVEVDSRASDAHC